MPKVPKDLSYSISFSIDVVKRLKIFGIDNDFVVRFSIKYANAVLDELKRYGELDYKSRIEKKEPKDICYDSRIPNYRLYDLYKILADEFSKPEEIYDSYMIKGDYVFDIMLKDSKPRLKKALEDFVEKISRLE